jgi:DNA polymerase (family 10)
MPESLERRVMEGRSLKGVPGVGEAIAGKIIEMVTTGRVATYEREKASLPEVAQLLLRVPGFTPKTAWRVVQELGATSADELGRAAAAGKPDWLPAAGEGSLEAIRSYICGGAPAAR